MGIEEKYVIIFGETGSGKSTFINYLTNFFYGGTLDNLKISIPNRFHRANMEFSYDEHAVGDGTKSQTSKCHCYTFQLETMSFHFIDTPGINDTAGLLQDSRNLEKIFDYIEELPQIDAFLLVLNGALSRFTSNILHVLSSIKERLPDSLYLNMLIVLTNCYSHSVNFEPNLIGIPNKCPVFYMQNSVFSSDPRSWPPQAQERFANEFKSSMATINSIVQALCKLESQPTSTFKYMSDDRNTLKRELHDARLALMDLQHLEDEFNSIALTADIHTANMEKFRNYLQCRSVTHLRRCTTPYYNTTCSKCSFLCHEDCKLDEMPATGNKMFNNCIVMSTGVCTVCRGHCKAKDHYHDRSILVPMQTTVEEVVTSLEQRYQEAVIGRSNADAKCKNIQEAKKMIDAELQKQYNKVKETIGNLQANCSGFNVTSELSDFILDLKRDISALQSRSVIDKANSFIASLEQLWNTFNESAPPNRDQHRQRPTDTEVSSTLSKSIDAPLSDDTINVRPKVTVRRLLTPSQQQGFHEQSSPKVTSGDGARLSFQRLNSFNHVNETQEIDIDREEPVNNKSVGLLSQKSDQTQMPLVNPSNTNAENKLEQFEKYTLDELIRASGQNRSKQLRKELNNRCLGKSLGLLTNNELFRLCEQFAELRSKELRELISIRDEIIEEIGEETDDDPFSIAKVNSMKLLRLAAANLLVRNPVSHIKS